MKNLAVIFILAMTACRTAPVNEKLSSADWESMKQYRVPDWFRDAKFGIYFHWGVYSVPAYKTEWYSWCNIQDPDYKSTNRLIDFLLDVVSKNGCQSVLIFYGKTYFQC
jgi:hypothetical protein